MHSSNPTTSHSVCEDLVLAILSNLPSKSLVPLRGVSRLFVELIDEVLRARFGLIAHCQTTGIVLESCEPYNSIKPSRQALVFSHFDESVSPVEGLTARFSVATRQPHYLPLDEHEIFANNLLGVTLENIEQIEPAIDQPRTFHAPYTRAAGNPNPPSRTVADYSWQLSLGSSLDRLFREWFFDPSRALDNDIAAHMRRFMTGVTTDLRAVQLMDDDDSDGDVLAGSPPSSREGSPRPHLATVSARIQVLEASNQWPTSSKIPSAFKSAELLCLTTAKAVAPPPYPFRPSVGPQVFEYYFDTVCLDVAKVVVATEEALKGKEKSPFVLVAL
ncbi:hypothetical protein JCM11491_003055 [Sporobolomyces phaffii]